MRASLLPPGLGAVEGRRARIGSGGLGRRDGIRPDRELLDCEPRCAGRGPPRLAGGDRWRVRAVSQAAAARPRGPRALRGGRLLRVVRGRRAQRLPPGDGRDPRPRRRGRGAWRHGAAPGRRDRRALMARATATFTLDTFEQDPPHDEVEGVAASRVRITKTFRGDLEATSTVEMLAIEGVGGRAYVALELVTG